MTKRKRSDQHLCGIMRTVKHNGRTYFVTKLDESWGNRTIAFTMSSMRYVRRVTAVEMLAALRPGHLYDFSERGEVRRYLIPVFALQGNDIGEAYIMRYSAILAAEARATKIGEN